MQAALLARGNSGLSTHTTFAMLALRQAWLLSAGKRKICGKVIKLFKQWLLQNHLKHH